VRGTRYTYDKSYIDRGANRNCFYVISIMTENRIICTSEFSNTKTLELLIDTGSDVNVISIFNVIYIFLDHIKF
jgi:hypothetical protein